jgi:hypothetical protein
LPFPSTTCSPSIRRIPFDMMADVSELRALPWMGRVLRGRSVTQCCSSGKYTGFAREEIDEHAEAAITLYGRYMVVKLKQGFSRMSSEVQESETGWRGSLWGASRNIAFNVGANYLGPAIPKRTPA